MTNEDLTDNDSDRPPAIQQVETMEFLELGGDALERALSDEQIAKNPHRDPERLREEWADAETVVEVAEELDSSSGTVSKWMATFGIREKRPGNYPRFVVEAMQSEGSA